MSEPRWVTARALRALHSVGLAQFGGPEGVRDEGLLDSALARPKNLFAYGATDPAELAAGYAFALVRNHPFVDGNKRAGFLAAALFLELNGFRLVASEVEAAVQTLALAAADIEEGDYARWLGANIVAR